jgi:hypothetical protein
MHPIRNPHRRVSRNTTLAMDRITSNIITIITTNPYVKSRQTDSRYLHHQPAHLQLQRTRFIKSRPAIH